MQYNNLHPKNTMQAKQLRLKSLEIYNTNPKAAHASSERIEHHLNYKTMPKYLGLNLKNARL